MINIEDSLIVSKLNQPLDSRTRVTTVSDIKNIKNPAIGTLVYCEDNEKFYVITELADKTYTNGLVVQNAAVGAYKELETGGKIKNIYIGDNGNWFINDVDQGVSATGPEGPAGPVGLTGPKSIITKGTVTIGQSSDDYDISFTDTAQGQALNITIPRGLQGEPGPVGPANVLSKGEFGVSDNPEDWKVEFTDTSQGQALNITIPRGLQGEPGPPGDKNILKTGTVSLGNSTEDYAVDLVTDPDTDEQFLNIVLPAAQGLAIGAVGDNLDSRDLYNDEPIGFCFLDNSTGTLYFRKDNNAGTWTAGIKLVGPKGDTGDRGPTGATPLLTIGDIETLNPGEEAYVRFTQDEVDSNTYKLHMGLPKGAQGDTGLEGPTGPTGPMPELVVGEVTQGETPSATITENAESGYSLNLVLPKGDTGPTGPVVDLQATAVKGAVAGVTVDKSIENTAIFNFTLPQGEKGMPGDPPNIAVGTVTTLPAESNADVIITRSDIEEDTYILDFAIPAGNDGKDGFHTLYADNVNTSPVQNPFEAAITISKAIEEDTGLYYQLVSYDIPCGAPIEVVKVDVNITAPDKPASAEIITVQTPTLVDTPSWEDYWKTKQELVLNIPKTSLHIIKQIEEPTDAEEGTIWIQP